MDPRGSKKEPPGGEISTPGGSEMAVWRPLEASRGVLGGRSGSGGRSWRQRVALVFFETAQKVFFLNFQGPSWGPLGGFWADFGSFPPSRGRAGEAPEGHFWKSYESCSPRGQKDEKNKHFCCMLGAVFYAIFYPLLRALRRALRRRESRKNMKINWFLWVERRMRLFRAKAEAIKC